MFSKQAAKSKLGSNEGFRWRGTEITRIEGLSDAVFAFAVALLIVSTEVPKNYDELLLRLGDFFPFAACFVILMLIWYNHYLYHRRYGLEDLTSIVLTMVLLFLVLFYTYPLKFIFMVWLRQGVAGGYVLKSYEELSIVFTIYALGYIAVFVVFFFMYLHAYRKRDMLKLNEIEIWDTRHSMRDIIFTCVVGCISLILANVLSGPWVALAGPAYMLLMPIGWLHGNWADKRRKQIHERTIALPET